MIYRDYIRDYDMKMRQADRIVRERAGDTLNVFDFIPPAENLEAAYLIVRALIERYLSILLRFYSNCCYDCSSRVYY